MDEVKLLLAGDSTMSFYEMDRYPRMGWGQALSYFFDDKIKVINHAASGRSTKSFMEEGRWEALENRITKGDFVLIQFGHNDQKPDKERATEPFSSYQRNLTHFVEATWRAGANPILLTSIARRHFDQRGQLKDTHGDYPEAMRQLAERLQIACIDMLQLTSQAIERMGEVKSKEWFMQLAPGESENYPIGEQDNTHLQEKGAYAVAELFVKELIERGHPLASYLAKDFVNFGDIPRGEEDDNLKTK